MNFIVKPHSLLRGADTCNVDISCGSATCVGNCPSASGCGINRV